MFYLPVKSGLCIQMGLDHVLVHAKILTLNISDEAGLAKKAIGLIERLHVRVEQ